MIKVIAKPSILSIRNRNFYRPPQGNRLVLMGTRR